MGPHSVLRDRDLPPFLDTCAFVGFRERMALLLLCCAAIMPVFAGRKTHNSLECLAERSIGLVANGLRNINQLLIVAVTTGRPSASATPLRIRVAVGHGHQNHRAKCAPGLGGWFLKSGEGANT